ncbi:hypothetical protein SADUNF_Sadunf09G0134300 [Salix dunnii]|uniref:Serine-threonine/tyrosine-protein kinase catalytic domain-containing protein n=1 Tax=Salix dunnii TaxID=1413687 RepID=A0A835JS54_9ROSI|nr:hypothetical protein SADUNF_Sadunf09G0134300 [Salix dunnii]
MAFFGLEMGHAAAVRFGFMGICWGSSAHTPSTTGHLSTRISHTTGNNASSGGSNGTSSRGSDMTAHSRFSAGSGDEEFPDGQILPTPNLRIFSFAELKIATRNFKSDTLLGEGGFGQVYKGWLDEKAPGRIGSGTIIAVKRLNSESSQGFEEWQVTCDGHLYVKSDVYGFGVVLVEILTGLRALDTSRPSGRHSLVDWIKPYLSDKRKLKSIMDSHLEGRYPSKAALQIAQLALNCLESEHKHRPHMKEVVATLERIEASKERQGETRNRPNCSVSHQNSQQPLQYYSPLHPIPDGSRGYQQSPRASTRVFEFPAAVRHDPYTRAARKEL